MKSTIGALLVASAALLTTVAPVAASTGRVGSWSLTDTASRPGATAKYRYVEETGPYAENHWLLHRIVVWPPNVKAVAGKSQQSVGWSFTIQRITCFEPPCYWEDRYTSPVFAAVTSDSANAPFAKASVSVRVPPGEPGLHHYRALVKVFWYRRDGSVQGTANARVHYYKTVTPGAVHQVQEFACDAAIYD